MRTGPLTLFAAAVVLAAATAAGAMEVRHAERMHAHGAFPDSVFLAGGELEVEATTPDDMFLAGGRIRAEGAGADHLFVAGGSIRLSPVQAEDVIAAGGEIDFEQGGARDDVVAAGGRLRLHSGFTVGGSAMLAGGEVEIDSSIGADVRAAGGEVRLNGPVAGDVELRGDTVIVGPEARIGGDLTYSANHVEISPSAVVMGRTLARPMRGGGPQQAAAGAAAAAVVFILAFALGCAILVGVLAVLFPRLMAGAGGQLRERLLPSFGIGFLVLFATPVVIALLFVSVLGAPLALVTLAVFLTAMPFATAAVACFLGMWARAKLRRSGEPPPAGAWARFGWTLLGFAALSIVGMLPIIGQLVWLATTTAGLGALAGAAGPSLRRA